MTPKLCRILDCLNLEEAKGFCKEHLADPDRRKKPWKPLEIKNRNTEVAQNQRGKK